MKTIPNNATIWLHLLNSLYFKLFLLETVSFGNCFNLHKANTQQFVIACETVCPSMAAFCLTYVEVLYLGFYVPRERGQVYRGLYNSRNTNNPRCNNQGLWTVLGFCVGDIHYNISGLALEHTANSVFRLHILHQIPRLAVQIFA